MAGYKPIQCELHDSFELACLRQLIDQVIWRDDSGQLHRDTLCFLDTAIGNGEEFLIAANQNGKQFRIRLDRIESAPPGR